MSEIVNDLCRKLKRAEREASRAQRAYDAARGEASNLLRELNRSQGRVREIADAIEVLRAHLQPTSLEVENVVSLGLNQKQ
jgi:hypothetical protein